MNHQAAGKAEIIGRVLESLAPGEPHATLVPLLFARPPAEDLAAFEPRALGVAAGRAAAALDAHRVGGAIVRVERPEGLTLGGEPLQLVTIVKDDMPFLFDSVVAEIVESNPAIHTISHPLLDVVRSGEGRILSFAAAKVADPGAAGAGRVSLIQVSTAVALDPEAGAALERRLEAILDQVALANRDFEPMRERVGRAVAALRARAADMGEGAPRALVLEAADFLDWLRERHFIFLGLREFDYRSAGEGAAMIRRAGSDLGILTDPNVRILRREGGEGAEASPELRAFLEAPDPLIVAKANSRAIVHRRVYMDYVGIKQYDAGGALCGELRILGLFTSSAYTQSVLAIPYLRLKAETVVARFGFHPGSHSAKALANALETYSRDEVFQIDVDLLERFVGIVTELGERPRVRILPRVDRFDRFASILVFVPRARYDTRLREEIGLLLAKAYDGHVSAFYPSFPEGSLASVHFIIGRRGGRTPEPDVAGLEREVAALARDWMDDFERAVAGTGHARELMALAPGLPDGYRDLVGAAEAVLDAGRIGGLSEETRLALDFYRRDGDAADLLRLKIYHLGSAVALSTRVPILENMGFAPVSERTFEIRRPDGAVVHLHDMDLRRRSGGDIALPGGGTALEDVFAAVSDARIENDAFNALVLEAGLGWREANVLRAYGRYLRQAGLAYSGEFLAGTLLRQPAIARLLFALFDRAFDPARERGPVAAAPADEDGPALIARERGAAAELAAIREALDAVTSLDDDRILRRFLSVILATLRTNFHAVPEVSADPASRPGAVRPALAFKLDSALVEGLPAPVPFREIFVFDARVEGVHLRFGRVARGGLRWSDRSQDYRTEVLGLVKAQQVKNAVIVPVGAKGGFLPKQLPDPAARDAWFEAGRAAYVVFVASLLSVTDNVTPDGTVTPPGVLRHDDEDPYFVVAADKGTATFSDTANSIAVSEGFWLDDAFASGGSAGYDHKAMGITARGAWEAVARHFREMDRDIAREPFTVAGCGDMSGDVFGNGMLLSPEIRLVAAFDHRDIFIDPDPDPAASLAERRRLFSKPRSSWADYDPARISAGGGVFSRRDKRIVLSAAAAAAIGWDRRAGTPAEIIAAILKSPVDLLWFGGIGTYVRAAGETNLDVGDRANDAVRVTGREIRAKVVGEGANLGVTQRGRIEFARAGGRVNTDAIDNSAGVNTSDVEVNIKIALKSAMAEGRLARPDRDRLLAAMTPDVAALVLANNYGQTLAISLEEAAGRDRLALQARFMTVLEEAGRLDRDVETLPGDAALADLRASGRVLTRPEIAVLLAYAKIDLFDRILESDLPDEPYLRERLFRYFPVAMRADFARDIDGHRLRREIVATGLAGDLVNRLGLSFLTAMRDATGAAPASIVRAFLAAADGLGADPLFRRVDALDGRIAGATQNALYGAVSQFLQIATAGFVRDATSLSALQDTVAALAAMRADFGERLPGLATERARDEFEARRSDWIGKGVAADLAADVARLPLVALLPDIALVSRETGSSSERVVAAYFGVTQLFRIGRLENALFAMRPGDYYETLALERAGSQIATARRRMTATALRDHPAEADPVAAWANRRRDSFARVGDQIGQLVGTGDTSVARLTLAAGLLLDLAG